jgi:hypothetical protein
MAESDVFVWDATGVAVDIGFSFWSDGEPNNYWGNEECLILSSGSLHAWNDEHCDDEERYICESAL